MSTRRSRENRSAGTRPSRSEEVDPFRGHRKAKPQASFNSAYSASRDSPMHRDPRSHEVALSAEIMHKCLNRTSRLRDILRHVKRMEGQITLEGVDKALKSKLGVDSDVQTLQKLMDPTMSGKHKVSSKATVPTISEVDDIVNRVKEGALEARKQQRSAAATPQFTPATPTAAPTLDLQPLSSTTTMTNGSSSSFIPTRTSEIDLDTHVLVRRRSQSAISSRGRSSNSIRFASSLDNPLVRRGNIVAPAPTPNTYLTAVRKEEVEVAKRFRRKAGSRFEALMLDMKIRDPLRQNKIPLSEFQESLRTSKVNLSSAELSLLTSKFEERSDNTSTISNGSTALDSPRNEVMVRYEDLMEQAREYDLAPSVSTSSLSATGTSSSNRRRTSLTNRESADFGIGMSSPRTVSPLRTSRHIVVGARGYQTVEGLLEGGGDLPARLGRSRGLCHRPDTPNLLSMAHPNRITPSNIFGSDGVAASPSQRFAHSRRNSESSDSSLNLHADDPTRTRTPTPTPITRRSSSVPARLPRERLYPSTGVISVENRTYLA